MTEQLTLSWEMHQQTHTHAVLATGQAVIGRRDDCDIVIAQPTISRRHAMIFARQGAFYVRNLSRTNSVRINDDTRLGHEQSAPIKPGDVLRLGPIMLQVLAAEQEAGGELMIRCPNCGREADYAPESFCPWCGMSLAGGETIIGLRPG